MFFEKQVRFYLQLKTKRMRKLFLASALFFCISCGSKGDINTSSDSANIETNKGNAAGSNIVEMDTLRMDTSNHSIPADSVH